MATQAEVDAGLAVLNENLDRLVKPLYRSTVDEMLTEDIKFNLILDILNAARTARQK
jgi:hypothetical protein